MKMLNNLADISKVVEQSKIGEYMKNISDAQKTITENEKMIDEAFNQLSSNEKRLIVDVLNYNPPWNQTEEDRLIGLVKAGTPISVISETLIRKPLIISLKIKHLKKEGRIQKV